MRRSVLLCALVMAHCAAVPAMAGTLIFRIDSARVTTMDRRIQIVASGAVRTGGWSNAQLRVKQGSAPEAKTMEVEFVAEPPAPEAVVVQGLMPVHAIRLSPLPHDGTTRIRIIGESNSVTVPIGR